MVAVVVCEERAWAKQTFGGCDLGDPRRVKRLRKVAEVRARTPHASLVGAMAATRHRQ